MKLITVITYFIAFDDQSYYFNIFTYSMKWLTEFQSMPVLYYGLTTCAKTQDEPALSNCIKSDRRHHNERRRARVDIDYRRTDFWLFCNLRQGRYHRTTFHAPCLWDPNRIRIVSRQDFGTFEYFIDRK